MSRKVRIIVSCLLVVLALGAGIFTYAQSNANNAAKADSSVDYFVDENGKIDVPPGGTDYDAKWSRGTEDNPLFILEIVPYEGVAQFGYHIAGCEPIDMERAMWDGEDVYGKGTIYTKTEYDQAIYYWDEEFPGYSGGNTATMRQYGVMTRVGDGSGTYNRTSDTYTYVTAPAGYSGTKYKDNGDGTYSEDNEAGTLARHISGGTYEKVTSGGEYVWEYLSVEECKALTEDEKKEYETSYHEGDSFKAFLPDITYHYKEYLSLLTHNNNFLKESVGLAYKIEGGKRKARPAAEVEELIANYHTVVYTVTPEDLNMNLELIARADMISFVSKDKDGHALEMYNKGYGKEEYFSHADTTLGKRVKNIPSATFVTNPLDWDTVLAIYNRVKDDDKACPVLFDTDIYSTLESTCTKSVSLDVEFMDGSTATRTGAMGTQNNLYKLFLLLYQVPTATLHTYFGDPNTYATVDVADGVKDKSGNKLKTGILSEYSSATANSYWNKFSLYPWGLLPNNNSDDYAPYLDTAGIMGDGSSIIHLFGAGAAQNYLRTFLYMNDGGTQLREGFMDDADMVDNQYNHEIYAFFESLSEPKEYVTPAECLYYLLNGLTPDTTTTQTYKILELQPSPDYYDVAFWINFIRGYANSEGAVEVDQMTTSEFIGKRVECLSEYDMVFLGTNKMETDLTLMAYHTNDTFPFVYAHTGPVVNLSEAENTAMFGWLGTGASLNAQGVNKALEKQFALSGNDLTSYAMDKLKTYAEKGYPLVFGEGFFTNKDATTVASTIDRNSNVYRLANGISSNKRIYLSALSEVSTHASARSKLYTALRKSVEVELIVTKSPVLYDSSKATDAEKYINVNSAGIVTEDRRLVFEFTVDAPSSWEFYVSLYVDINGDGKFAEGENIGADVQLLPSGKVETKVKGGNTYRVSRQVDDRVGSVNWKLDLVQKIKEGDIEKEIVFQSLTGLSAIKTNTKESLRILQIISKERQTVFLPETGEGVSEGTEANITENGYSDDGASGTVQITNKQRQVTQWFYKYSKDINGFNISFTRMTEAELFVALEGDRDYLLNNFEMVVLGFADAYNGVGETDADKDGVPDEYNVMDAIEDFRMEGKAVLYTHDTSSLVGYSEDTTLSKNFSWGGVVTEKFRDVFGMDRYDAGAYRGTIGETRADYPYLPASDSGDSGKMVSPSGSSDYILTQGMSNGVLYRFVYNMAGTNYNDILPSMIAGNELKTTGNRKECEDHNLSGTYAGKITSPFNGVALYGNDDVWSYTGQYFANDTHDFFVRGASNGTKAAKVDLVIGGTTVGTFIFNSPTPTVYTLCNVKHGKEWQTVELKVTADDGTWDVYLDYFDYAPAGTLKSSKWLAGDINLETNTITRVNQGGITEYPYTIAESITTATTHTQYYQLDMERDDIVVWYCLGQQPSGAADYVDAYYAVTPNDVRNNYYIYNINNVTYSGMGHSGDLTEEEVKLFVNTFVAAYRASAKPANVKITNTDATSKGDTYYLCVDLDSSDGMKLIGENALNSYYLQVEDTENGGYKRKDTPETSTTLKVPTPTEPDKTVTLTGVAPTKRVYFKVNDTSSNGTAKYRLKFFLDDATTPIDLAVFRKSDDAFIDHMSGDLSMANIVHMDKEDMFYVDVPLKIENTTSEGANTYAISTTKLVIEVGTSFDTSTGSKPTIAYTTAIIVPRNLFDLD